MAAAAKISTIKKLKTVLEDRFPEMNSEFFKAIKIYDPHNWRDEADFGVRELNILLGRFLVPLSEAGISERDLFVEWKRFRSFAKRHFEDLFKEPKMLWRRVLNFRRLEFPNLSLVIELITCIAGSNSSVERAFSLLTLLLNDRRLSMSHETMEDLLLTKANDSAWSEAERKGIIARAVEIYLEKRRKVQLARSEQEGEQPSKKRRTEELVIDEAIDSEPDSSDYDTDFDE